MEYPIPDHLKDFFELIGENNEFQSTGEVKCSCGATNFNVDESNDKGIVKLVCSTCGKDILAFDAGKHGWDGFVCKDDYLDRERPFTETVCPKCGNSTFSVRIKISSQGKVDFIDECVNNDDSFTEDDWVNGFDWITIYLTCLKCTYQQNEWMDYETM